MVNVIIDSSTYSNIIADIESGDKVAEAIIRDETFIVRNFKLIRDELRKAPKRILAIYDEIVSKNMISDSHEISKLAEDYLKEYKNNDGGVGRKKIMNDLKIVACATIKKCDLVFSDDNRTLKSDSAIKAYKIVNLKFNYRTPTFYSYKDLKQRYSIS